MIELIKKYRQLKAKNVVSVAKIGNAYALACKRFDPITGEELPEEIISVDLEQLRRQKTELESQISEIDAFISDCQELN